MDLNRLYVNIFLLILLAGIMIYLFRPIIREGKSKKGKSNPFSKAATKLKKFAVKNPVSQVIAKGAECLKYSTQFAFFRGVEEKIRAGHGSILNTRCFFKISAEKLFPKHCEWIKLQDAIDSKQKALNNMNENNCPNTIKKK